MKTAVVTGGTRGIGKGIVLSLAQAGYRVYALYARNNQAALALDDLAKTNGYDIRCFRGDLTDPMKLQTIVDELKKSETTIDVIVHAAASGVHRDAFSLTQKHMSWTFDINVIAIHELLRNLIPLVPMGGRIIGVTSGGGDRVIPYYAAVGASKGALNALFRHYAVELAPKGISVNLVCPGMVMTDAIDAFPEKENRVDIVL